MMDHQHAGMLRGPGVALAAATAEGRHLALPVAVRHAPTHAYLRTCAPRSPISAAASELHLGDLHPNLVGLNDVCPLEQVLHCVRRLRPL